MARKTRVSSRKRNILAVLEQSEPAGVMLQNELRYTVLRMERATGSTIAQFDFNRSFKRTLQEYSADHLRHLSLDQRTSAEITSGIIARFGMWQLLEKGYASVLPTPQACAVVVGRDAFSILGTLVDGARVLLYSGEFSRIEFVSSGAGLDAKVLSQIEGVDWPLYQLDANHRLVRAAVTLPARKLNSIPEVAAWEDDTEQYLKRRQDNFLFDR